VPTGIGTSRTVRLTEAELLAALPQ
jgi:hypothetical protein